MSATPRCRRTSCWWPRCNGWKSGRTSALEEEDADLLALLQALAEHPMVASLDMGADADGQQALGNQLAYLLPFTEADKIDLLQLDDPQQRLDAIQRLLDELQGELFT